MLRNKLISSVLILMVLQVIWSCKADGDYPGLEYAPNMYHSVPYEPLSQIIEEEEGQWLSDREDGTGEYYNSNPYNPHNMTMRMPVPGSVKRRKDGLIPYDIPKDSLELASRVLQNPLDSTEEVISHGKVLYSRFCQPCHGVQGQGDGKVGQVLKGVPAYNVGRVKEVNGGHIFHVITHGKGRMGAHGSQIDIADRWRIVRYVQTLQNQN